MKILKNYLKEDPSGKMKLAQEFRLTTTIAIDQWISRGKLPKFKRTMILKFIREAA